MGVEDPQLKRTLLGYSRDKVRRVLTDHEAMFARATEDVHAAEEKAEAAEEKARAADEKASVAQEKTRATEERLLELEAELVGVRRELEDRAEAAEEKARAADEKASVAQEKTRATEERLLELEAELVGVRRELEDRAEAASRRADGEPDVGDVVAAGLPVSAGGLTAVLEATEKAVTQLIEDARHRGEEQLREAERRQKELETKIEQLSEWWNRVEPLVTDVRGSIDEAKDQVTSVPGRIGSVLEPVTQAFGSLGNRLATLTQMAAIPINGTPEADRGRPPSPPQVVEVGEPDQDVVDDPADAKLEQPGRKWWP